MESSVKEQGKDQKVKLGGRLAGEIISAKSNFHRRVLKFIVFKMFVWFFTNFELQSLKCVGCRKAESLGVSRNQASLIVY